MCLEYFLCTNRAIFKLDTFRQETNARMSVYFALFERRGNCFGKVTKVKADEKALFGKIFAEFNLSQNILTSGVRLSFIHLLILSTKLSNRSTWNKECTT